ncbi:PREDICTED: uncharacterized protein LOC109474505 [Branchiostoma belcheri]|uniref:Uncharacterized protein LOC109474505 n=1 Tax=Branchiostoma belcheri TaxID=7741 RepID=A0A6P4Z8Z1_BRABE|nr:PREDICTED: uncharacterized protein LOC109474505 [Branchiostoma belcheri]
MPTQIDVLSSVRFRRKEFGTRSVFFVSAGVNKRSLEKIMASKGQQVVEEVIQKTDVNAPKGKRQQVSEDVIVPTRKDDVPARKEDYVPGAAPPPEVIQKTLETNAMYSIFPNADKETIVGGNVSLMVSIFERKQEEERRTTNESPQTQKVSRREEGDLVSSFNASLREEEEEKQRQMEELRERLKEERGLMTEDARIVQTTSEVLLTMGQNKEKEMEVIRAQLKEERVNISEDGKIVETSKSALLSEEEAKRVQLELEKADLVRQRMQLSGDASLVEKAKGALFTTEEHHGIEKWRTDGKIVSTTTESIRTYQQGDEKVEIIEAATTYTTDEVEGTVTNIVSQAEMATPISELQTTEGESGVITETSLEEIKSGGSDTTTVIHPPQEIEKTIGESQVLIDDIIALTRAKREERMSKRQTTSVRTITSTTSGEQVQEMTKTETVVMENGETDKACDEGMTSFHTTASETRVETTDEVTPCNVPPSQSTSHLVPTKGTKMASRRVRYGGRQITANQRQVLGTGWKGAKTTVTTVTTVRTSNTRTQSGESASESAATNRMSQEEIQQHIPEPLPEVPGIDFKQFDDVCDLADDMLREEDNPPVPVQETTSSVHYCEDPAYHATRIPGVCIRKLNCNGCAAQYRVARATCEAEGASLLTQLTEEKFELLAEEDYYNLQGSWIGLDDIAVEGTYVWNDGSPLGSFRPFHPTVPNDEETDCVIVGRNVGSVWAPYDCNNKVRYICQKPSTCPNVTTSLTTIANSTTERTTPDTSTLQPTPPAKTTDASTTKVTSAKTSNCVATTTSPSTVQATAVVETSVTSEYDKR